VENLLSLYYSQNIQIIDLRRGFAGGTDILVGAALGSEFTVSAAGREDCQPYTPAYISLHHCVENEFIDLSPAFLKCGARRYLPIPHLHDPLNCHSSDNRCKHTVRKDTTTARFVLVRAWVPEQGNIQCHTSADALQARAIQSLHKNTRFQAEISVLLQPRSTNWCTPRPSARWNLM